MALYFPKYNRGQSQTGYVVGCVRNKRLTEAVPSFQDRVEICRDHLREVRDAMIAFQDKPKKS